jgi:hypothetical protein
MPLTQDVARKLVSSRHPEWREHQRAWRWLADSLEGGDRYASADYACDPTAPGPYASAPWYQAGVRDHQTGLAVNLTYDQVVDRNLVPHRREMSEEGKDLYAMRLARTPVPEVVNRTVELHLSKIFGRDVTRAGPADLEVWWKNVDGRDMSIQQWIEQTVAPLLLVLGQLDIVVEHPQAPPGARVDTRADSLALGLNGAVASIILPENVVWWALHPDGRYRELLVCERGVDGSIAWRHWTEASSDCYLTDGTHVASRSYEHAFGAVPVVRVFDRRKPRCENVGRARYQEVAALQKATYNGTSELILSDIQQAHAQLMAPEEYCGPNSEIPVGDSGIVLPMRAIKDASGFTASYQPFTYLDPPKGAQAELRQHLLDFNDQADRAGALAKPAGMNSGTTTGQSGISKIADQQDGNAVLARVAEVLERAEETLARLVLRVLADGEPSPADLDAIEIEYPRQFDLFSAADVANVLDAVQRGAQQAGSLPLTEAALLRRLVALILPGLDEEDAAAIRKEIDTFTQEAAAEPEPEPPPVLLPMPPQVNDGRAITAPNGSRPDPNAAPNASADPEDDPAASD